MALHDALGSRWVVYIGRAVAAVALLFGLAAAAPVLLVDAAAASGSTSLPSAALQLIFLTSTANLAGYPVLLAGAVAVVAPALARGGRLDSIGLLVIAFAWALAFLPQSVLLADGRTPALDGVLVVGTATLVVALVSGRLSSRGRHVVVAVCGIATVAVLGVWFIEPSSRGSLIWASAIPAAIAAFGATIAYWWLPQVAWRQAFPRTFAITLIALVALPCEMAAAAVLAAGEDQTRAAAVLAALLGFTLLVYAGVLLALHVRRPLEFGGYVDIDRPPELVFAEVARLGGGARPWNPTEHEMTLVTDAPVGTGSRLRHSSREGMRMFTVRDFDPPRAFSLEMDPTVYRVRSWYEVALRAPAGSRLSWRQVMHVPLYWWLRRSYHRMVRGRAEEMAQRYLACKRHLEENA